VANGRILLDIAELDGPIYAFHHGLQFDFEVYLLFIVLTICGPKNRRLTTANEGKEHNFSLSPKGGFNCIYLS